jgi:malonyl-CoA O-methyltransferase
MQKFDKNIIRHNFSAKASSYEANSRLQKRVAIELLSRVGKLDGKILDIGAGTGMIRENSDFAGLVEMDFSLDMCKKNSGLVVNADAENLPFADASFDHVISSLTIQWLNNLDVFAAEMKRVLKSGGSFHLSTFGNGTLTELSQSFAKIDDDAHIIRFPNTIFLFAVLKKAGFDKIDIHAQTITYRHDNAMEILQQMKHIGATYPLRSGAKGLAGKGYFNKLNAVYRKDFADDDGKLPVTWNTLYITGKKN